MFKLSVGIFAASLTTIAFLPQAIKTWRTKSTDDLSPLLFILFCIGVIGWFTYGVLLKDIIMIIGNTITIMLAGSILYFIIRQKYTRKISHVALWVSDIEKSRNFYVDNLNGKSNEIYKNPKNDFCSYFISFTSGPHLEIMSSISGTKQIDVKTKPHFAISVGSKKAVKKLTQELEDKNIAIVSQPRKTGDGYYESVIEDPDGNLIELTI